MSNRLPEFIQRGHVIVLALAAFALLGCASSSSSPETSRAATSEETPRIRIGMTRTQVLRAWGEPSSKQVSGRGEIWVWGGQNWKRMIPYAGPFLNVQTSKVVFDSGGRVKDFRVTDKGDMMSASEGYSMGFNPW